MVLIGGVEKHAVVMNALRRIFSDNDPETRDIIMTEKETSSKENIEFILGRWFHEKRPVCITHTYLLKKWVKEVDIAAPGHTCGRIFDRSVASVGKVTSTAANVEIIEIDDSDNEVETTTKKMEVELVDDKKLSPFSYSGKGDKDEPFIID